MKRSKAPSGCHGKSKRSKIQPQKLDYTTEAEGLNVAAVAVIEQLCARCDALDIEGLLTANKPRSYADIRSISGGRFNSRNGPYAAVLLDLGLYQDLDFQSDCPLCGFLRGLIDPPAIQPDEPLYLVPALSIHRIEPDVSMVQYGQNCNYANYIYVGQMIDDRGQRRLQYCHEVPNAFGGIENSSWSRPMQPRAIKPGEVDYTLIHRWIGTCRDNHGDFCRVTSSPELSIVRLIDAVEKRIVWYRDVSPCDYLCLSYVWGGPDFYRKFDGQNLEELPTTISDALEIVRRLGKRYIWIDMLCIDQGDEENKMRHIEIMSKIYQGAWVSIVALDAQNANSGIARTGRRATGEAAATRTSTVQLTCTWKERRLMSLQPTLSQQVARSTWQTRAWTYQEAILSPRCLFFTAAQVYFECNTAQCCESIDESDSSYHSFRAEERVKMLNGWACYGWTQNALGAGVLRNPLVATRFEDRHMREKHRGERYGDLVECYSAKHMSYDADALNAFQAILGQLSDGGFERGFFWGLPVEMLPQALLWQHRSDAKRRLEFPSWSWAGWRGELFSAGDYLDYGSWYYQPPFRAFKASNTDQGEIKLIQLYENSRRRWSGWCVGYDPILDLADVPVQRSVAYADFSQFEIKHTLFVEAILFQPGVLQPAPSLAEKYSHMGRSVFVTTVNGATRIFACIDHSAETQLSQGTAADLLLVNQICWSDTGWGYDFLILSSAPAFSDSGAVKRPVQRRGQVRMYFGNVGRHNETTHMFFPTESTRKAFIGLI